MMKKEMFWRDEYNVGIPQVDEAHQRLFREIRRVEKLLEKDAYEKYDCIETIKFLRDYTKVHFAQEEGHMRRLQYPYYEMHKRIHDNMMQETLPALEEKLRESHYAKEAIEEFIAVFAGWLSGHVLIEDRAISGKAQSKFFRKNHQEIETAEAIDIELRSFMQDMLDIDFKLVNKLYDGTHIDQAFLYEVTYNHQYTVAVIVQYPMILHMVGRMLGVEQKEMNSSVIMAFTQLNDSIAKAMLEIAFCDGNYEITDKKGKVQIDFEEYFAQGVPQHGLMWTSTKGIFALCINQIE